MAESLFQKARVAVLGKMHSLLDEVANNPDAYRQRIRDLERASADLRAADDEAVGTRNGYSRQVTQLQSAMAGKQANIDLMLGDADPANDDSALTLQMQLEDDAAQLTTLQELVTESNTNHQELQTAITQLDRKHQEMVSGLSRLTLAAAATKAKTRASAAAEAALEASSAASGASVDDIAAKINHDKDVADARFERVIGGLQSSTSPEEQARLARAQAALAARRAQITAEATASVTASAETTQEPAPATT